MSLKGNKILAIVPARGGSKGIPKKNIKKVAGKTLIKHVGDLCKDIDLIDTAIISTDCEEIAEEATNSGLLNLFKRPEIISDDLAKAKDVWIHAWEKCESIYGYKFDISLYLEPTSPLRIKTDIINSLKLLLSNPQIGSTATCSIIPGNLTPFKAQQLDKNGFITYYKKNGERFSNRQEIPNFYYRNGLCYTAKRDHLLNKNYLFEKNCKMLLTKRPVVNIDEEYELELAEFYLNKFKDY